jgi:hypothetical protein
MTPPEGNPVNASFRRWQQDDVTERAKPRPGSKRWKELRTYDAVLHRHVSTGGISACG